MIIEARVRTGVGFYARMNDGCMEIGVASPPEGNKANQEIVRELSKRTGGRVRILRGMKSKRKLIEMTGLDTLEGLDD